MRSFVHGLTPLGLPSLCLLHLPSLGLLVILPLTPFGLLLVRVDQVGCSLVHMQLSKLISIKTLGTNWLKTSIMEPILLRSKTNKISQTYD